MPAGPAPLGFAYFLATKYAGYSAYCHWVIKPRTQSEFTYIDDRPSSALAGGVRTLIGAAIGAVVGFGFWNIPAFSAHDTITDILFFSLLIPVRVGEWLLLLRSVYRRFPIRAYSWNRHPDATIVAGGILTSFALDFCGIFAAFVVPGGFWVC